MSIHRVDLDHVAIPFSKPYRDGEMRLDQRESILIRVFEEDWVGIGEVAPPLDALAEEDSNAIEDPWQDLAGPLITALFQADCVEVPEIINALDASGAGRAARCGLQTALWDLQGQKQNRPVYQLLGGKRRSVVAGLCLGWCDSVDELMEQIRSFLLSDGYRRVKIGIRPGWDLEPLETVRRNFPPNLKIVADGGGRYDPQQMADLIALDPCGLVCLEDPFPMETADACFLLRREMTTPLCLGQRLEGVEAVRQAVENEYCDMVNLNLSRLEGIEQARHLAQWLDREGVPVWVGSGVELGVGSVSAVHLASLSAMTYPTDAASSFRWYNDEVIRPLLTVRSGEFTLSKAPGLGIELSEKALKLYSKRSQSFLRRKYPRRLS